MCSVNTILISAIIELNLQLIGAFVHLIYLDRLLLIDEFAPIRELFPNATGPLLRLGALADLRGCKRLFRYGFLLLLNRACILLLFLFRRRIFVKHWEDWLCALSVGQAHLRLNFPLDVGLKILSFLDRCLLLHFFIVLFFLLLGLALNNFVDVSLQILVVTNAKQILVLENVDPRNLDAHRRQVHVKLLNIFDERLKYVK